MKNKYEVRGDKTIITLHRKDGKILETAVDTKELSRISAQYRSLNASFNKSNAQYYVRGYLNDGTFIQLHRFLTNAPDNLVVDHFNNDSLDNTLSNLRLIESGYNAQNPKGASKNSTSGILGVSWCGKRQKWAATIKINRKSYKFGHYDTTNEAAEVVSKARAKFMPYSKEAKILDASKIDLTLPDTDAIRGIDWHKSNKKWRVRLTIEKKAHLVGYFKMYDSALQILNETKNMSLEELIHYKDSKRKPKRIRPKKLYLENQSKVKGVSWKEKNKKWQARINVNGKRIYLGIYDKQDEAEEAVLQTIQKQATR